MQLILKEAKYRLGYLLISLIAFEACWYINESYDGLELSYFLIPIVLCGLLFRSKDEIEMIKVTNTRISNLLIIRYFISWFYVILLPCIRLITTSSINNGTRSAITLSTTLLLCTSFALFYRVVLKNPFATIVFSSFTHTLLLFTFTTIIAKFIKSPKALQRFSIFNANNITNKAIYTNNRMIVIAASIVIISASYIILRRKEKFYID